MCLRLRPQSSQERDRCEVCCICQLLYSLFRPFASVHSEILVVVALSLLPFWNLKIGLLPFTLLLLSCDKRLTQNHQTF